MTAIPCRSAPLPRNGAAHRESNTNRTKVDIRDSHPSSASRSSAHDFADRCQTHAGLPAPSNRRRGTAAYQFPTVNSSSIPYVLKSRQKSIIGAKSVQADRSFRIPRSGRRFDSGFADRRVRRRIRPPDSRSPRGGTQSKVCLIDRTEAARVAALLPSARWPGRGVGQSSEAFPA